MSPFFVLLSVLATSPGAAPPTYIEWLPANIELPATVQAILEKADSVELYSLDVPERADKKNLFQGRKVLGKTNLKGKKARTVLDQVLESRPSTRRAKERTYLQNPWHGLRVTHKGKSVDLLIDFRWRWLSVHQGKTNLGRFMISREAQAILDGMLRDGKVPIADRRKEEDKPSMVKRLLEKGDLVEVYSLEPSADANDKGERFHGYKVLGKVAVKDAGRRKKLIGQVAEALVPEVYDLALMAECFSPRHGYRLRYDGVTFDLLICFECSRISFAFDDEKQLAKLEKLGRWTRIRFDFALHECKAEPVVDKLLQDAKVPLAKKRKKD